MNAKYEGGVTQQQTDEMLKALGFTREQVQNSLVSHGVSLDNMEQFMLTYHVLGLMTLAWVKAKE